MKNLESFIRLFEESYDVFQSIRHNNNNYPTVSSMLQQEINRNIPDELKKLGLNETELALLIVVGIEHHPCRNLIKNFCESWCKSSVERIRTQMELQQSVDSGRLKPFLRYSMNQWRFRDTALPQLIGIFSKKDEICQ